MQFLLRPSKDSKGTLYLMRGWSGSGKSYSANEIGGLIFSTDDLWLKDGVYVFDKSQMNEKHAQNVERVREALEFGVESVVVDNTNTRLWEMRPYAELVVQFGYAVVIVEPDAPHRFDAAECARLCRHEGISEKKVLTQMGRFEFCFCLEDILMAEKPHQYK
ncbi:AAA family ATPase [Candidatus Woesearchaeota archaeon]|nr:AAA family ATPase [Candidatus Woesearchaeota archaeon]